MFESAELPHSIDKETYQREIESLRVRLLEAQFELKERADFPVLMLVSGHDGAGKSETIHQFYEWLDPRYLMTSAFGKPSDFERSFPPMWRFWNALPPKGRIGIFAGSWYSEPIALHVAGKISDAELDQRLARIAQFERMLADEGALLVKFWFHLSKKGQKRRLQTLASDPRTAWRVTQEHFERLKTYDQFVATSHHVMRLTHQPWAPWQVVSGEDDRYRHLMSAKIFLALLEERMNKGSAVCFPAALPALPSADGRDVLDTIDLRQRVDKKTYEHELPRLQGRIAEWVRSKEFAKRHSLVVVFEGMDAAGKGGSIRRLAQALDPRQFRIVPVAAPTDEERAQPYLWRFWRHVPPRGRITIYDRSWYGRVLVERVEGFCSEYDWRRAYSEINDFEHELVQAGAIVVKFWLHISQEEQLRRFQERERTPYKAHKLTPDDWRNREKWPLYRRAVCDMIDQTSTSAAPWTLVAAEDKRFGRLQVLRTVLERLEAALK